MDRNPPGSTPSLENLGERVREDVKLIRRAAERQRDEILGRVRELVKEQPLLALGAAFGIGYLLSGALISRATGKMLLLSSRLAFAALLKQLVAGGTLDLLPDNPPSQSSQGTL